ncbi:MAG TPA: DUF4115 domain-containing protein [Rhodocyclaceae bacterium]|jgi:cytoskeleton protein RodZ|nr:DUF4115 domain-containing protein [Rhodocyclaceae bacterium]HMV21036.1 DUF4115 domain-containing protein [Rhodocyclaceae bacterium]HMW77759.1 DUF4115 domain-containing protein [Rhodocyclaceae bacterium]HNE43380.1 DUF4115 domain-containing protein [Rhodocyclaceae bacterium]HNL21550.1 DUF4115 domain-containing protein [Rhodocyclaceae bacterium]
MNAEVYAASAETVDIPVLPSVGNQLSAAREAKGLTVADVAQALKLGVRQVEALESGTWGGLPGATFIRGFVRNYARLVEIDPAPLMEQLEGTLDRSAPRLDRPRGPETPMPAASAGRRRDLAVVGFGLGLVGLALVSYFLLPSDLGSLGDEIRSLVFAGKTQESTASPAAPVADPVLPPGATPQEVLTPQAVSLSESVPANVSATAVEAAALPSATADGSAAAASPSAPLRLVVERESWVEVKDGEGNLLLSQKLQPGSDRTVDGKGRFTLVIGNASGVRLSFRGQPVDLAPYTRGEVARLTLE